MEHYKEEASQIMDSATIILTDFKQQPTWILSNNPLHLQKNQSIFSTTMSCSSSPPNTWEFEGQLSTKQSFTLFLSSNLTLDAIQKHKLLLVGTLKLFSGETVMHKEDVFVFQSRFETTL